MSQVPVCVPVTVDVNQDIFDVDKLAVGISFFLGFLIGLAITVACLKMCCIKDLSKKKRQDAEMAMKEYEATEWRTRKEVEFEEQEEEEEETEEIIEIEITYPSEYAKTDEGITSALMQQDSEVVDVNLGNQDVKFVSLMDEEIRENRINIFISLFEIYLSNMINDGRLEEEAATQLASLAETNFKEIEKFCLEEKKQKEEELKKDPKYAKDPEGLEKALDDLYPEYVKERNKRFSEEQDKLHGELRRVLKEEDVDVVMANLTTEMAHAERAFADESARQAMALEERLNMRRLLVEQKNQAAEEQSEDIKTNVETHKKSLDQLVADGKLIERQKDDILKQYEDDLLKVQQNYEADVLEHQRKLSEELKKRRQQRMNQLAAQQNEERKALQKKVKNSKNGTKFVDEYTDMIQQQHIDREELGDELDRIEAEEMYKVLEDLDKTRVRSVEKQSQTLIQALEEKAQLSEEDIDRVMRIHQQEKMEMERIKDEEKRRNRQKIQERLAQRKQKLEEEQQKTVAEQQVLREQQQTAINKVLESQVELSEDAKQKILQEHEKNVQSLNSQLQMSKLRQKKKMEQKLNQRRAKVADLKHQKEKAREDEKGQLQAQLDAQIVAEEKKLEEERQQSLENLREQLAKETADALKLQDEQIVKVLARHQAGQARRRAIIENQDKTIQQLEEQIASKVTEGGKKPAGGTNQILQEHLNQVETIKLQRDEERQRSEQALREKIQKKKLKQKSEIEDKLDKEAETQLNEMQRRGAGKATKILAQMMLEQKYKQAMVAMEEEMRAEMDKQRIELRKQMELEMEKDLEVQQKDFIVQLAANSNLSKDDINELVGSAVAETGGNHQKAAALAKELRIEVKRAKTELYEEDARRPDAEDAPRVKSGRPRSSKMNSAE